MKTESDLDQRLVSRFCKPLDPPLGTSAASQVFNADLAHPSDSLQSVFQVFGTDVHRQTWKTSTGHLRRLSAEETVL